MIGSRAVLFFVPTYYELLGVDRNSSQEEIKKAYHELALTYHPDVNKTEKARDLMKLLNEAYEVLSDPEKRADYDDKLRMKKPDTYVGREQARPSEPEAEGRSDIDSSDYRVYWDEVMKHARPHENADTGPSSYEPPLHAAEAGIRIFSAFLDLIIIGLLSALVLLAILPSILSIFGFRYEMGDPLFFLTLFIMSFAYCALSEGSSAGATPGKWYFYIFVCDTKGGRISTESAIIRSFSKVSVIYALILITLSGFLIVSIAGLIGIVLALYYKNWTIHDYLAKTIVVKKYRYAI
jgi:uncharacterized RDD family membrane protein YckC